MKLTKNNTDILTRLVECRILTITQLSLFQHRSRQVIRRNIRRLGSNGLIGSKEQGYNQGRGRPEKVIFLTEKGIALLKNEGLLSNRTHQLGKYSPRDHLEGHHLLTNWFHLHLIYMATVIPQLSVDFIYATSHMLKTKGSNSLKERIKTADDIEPLVEFYPDGVFPLTYKGENDEKSLLFYLEVDMGTETLAGKNATPNNIRQKVLNYQALFRSRHYKRYERIFKCHLNGFRLLFLTNTHARMVSICRLIQDIPPSNFIWVTDQTLMFSHGLSAKIWARGDKKDGPRHSIMGSKPASESPLLDTIR